MTWTRRGPTNKPSPETLKYDFHEEHSRDSDSEENAYQYAAYFTWHSLAHRQKNLTETFPECSLEINALAYYYGLFLPKNHVAYDPHLNRYLRFFEPSQPQQSRPEITAFRDDIAKYHKQFTKG